MKQIVQDLKNGNTILEDVPAPVVRSGQVLIQTTRSLVSLGTERMLVEFGKAGWIEKARQQPERVKQVLNKIKTDGLKPTIQAVRSKLGQPLPLGYCNVGRVIAVGKGVNAIQVGDRVASNGHHAEVVSVPQNLVAKIPDNVSDEEASFTVIGAIALQGMRLAAPTFGETIVVIGLGLIGQVTAQLLKANGCNVIGIDYDKTKLDLAAAKGITTVDPSNTDVVNFIHTLTGNIGADGVIITASNKSNDIISQAANMSRKRGRIVLVGVVGLHINRSDFYEKELTFQVSCSYGPGRYDADYEQKGHDYPLPYVRWTEKRNFEAVLQAISSGQLDVQSLITEKVPLSAYQQIYGNISGSQSIASILEYPQNAQQTTKIQLTSNSFTGQRGVIGIIGAGNFTNAVILPILKKENASLKTIASSGGLSATTLARKFGISEATTDNNDVLNDTDIDLVFITTRHNTHASLTAQALAAGKHVFVEKPLALNALELDNLIEAYNTSGKTISVGFNRRFAPLAQKMKSLLGTPAPINIVATMNAGAIPVNSWVHDMETGGGRIIGEACHYIDLCTFLADSHITAVCMNSMGAANESTDNASILLRYANGTNAVINYFANGSKAYDKERVEVYSQERTLVMENWKKLHGYGFKGFSSLSSSQDKGHAAQFKRLLDSIRNGGSAIIPFDELINTTRASFAAIESLKTGSWIPLS